jgi:hypothetical protein
MRSPRCEACLTSHASTPDSRSLDRPCPIGRGTGSADSQGRN